MHTQPEGAELRTTNHGKPNIIFKPHAYIKTMKKSRVQFQQDRHKTVGEFADTSYPISIYFDSILAWKLTVF